MAYFITLLSIVCVTFSSGALSYWLHADKGVGCININGRGVCAAFEMDGQIPSWESRYVDKPPADCEGDACKVTVNIEFGFDPDSEESMTIPGYKQDFSFFPTTDQLFFTTDWCIVDESRATLACYNPDKLHGKDSTSNPYVALNYKGPRPRKMGLDGSGDTDLQANYVDPTDSINNWFQASSGGNEVPCEVYGTCGYAVGSDPYAPIASTYTPSLDPFAFNQAAWQ